MAMLIAWSICNKVANRQDPRFSDAVLVVCPNLTVRDRLQVLYPDREGIGEMNPSTVGSESCLPTCARCWRRAE